MQGFLGFVIRKNVPLEERLNNVISRLVEGNIIQYFFTKESRYIQGTRRLRTNNKGTRALR